MKTFRQIEFEQIEAEASGLSKKLMAGRPHRGRPAQGQSLALDQDAAIALLERCASQGIAPPEGLVALFRFLHATPSSSRPNRLTEQQREAVRIDARSLVERDRRASAPKLARRVGVSTWTVYQWRHLPAYQKELEARIASHLTEQLSSRNHPTEAATVAQSDPQRFLRSEATRRWPDDPFIRLLPDVGPKSELSPVELAQYLLDHSVVIRSPEQVAQHMFERGLQFAPDYGPALREIEAAHEDAVKQKSE